MKVVGFAPTTVRIELEACELPGLQEQLFTTIEAGGGSLREELERREDLGLSEGRLEEASSWLLEYRNLLSQISDCGRDGGATVLTPFLVADEVVEACATAALERLTEAVAGRASYDTVRLRSETVRAWMDTLADLRCLDAGGLESIKL